MEYVIEFYDGERLLEMRTSTEPFWPLPVVGDFVQVAFDDAELSRGHGNEWKITARSLLLFASDSNVRTIQLVCEPVDKENGHRLIFKPAGGYTSSTGDGQSDSGGRPSFGPPPLGRGHFRTCGAQRMGLGG